MEMSPYAEFLCQDLKDGDITAAAVVRAFNRGRISEAEKDHILACAADPECECGLPTAARAADGPAQ